MFEILYFDICNNFTDTISTSEHLKQFNLLVCVFNLCIKAKKNSFLFYAVFNKLASFQVVAVNHV